MKIDSEEWISWRKTKITASDAPVLLGLSPYRTSNQLLDEKIGLIPPQEYNYAMHRGKTLEPLALDYFEKETGILMIPEIVQHPTIEYMAATLDGRSLDEKFILEIKCNGKKNHALVESGEIPSYHMAQVQHQIEVAGTEFAYYLSFDGEKGIILEIKRDNDYIEKLIEKEKEFWHNMQLFNVI